MSYDIRKVAVIGAGTMGGGIAAHLANIGIPVVLLDIVPPNLSDEDKNNPQARNQIVQSLFKRMVKARPANLARKDRAELITLGNLEDDFDLIADCDWIVEVIIEKLEPKQQLMERIEAIRKPGSIISSNTSGIPISQIANGRSDDFKAHFLGTHFFNPPRYLKLLEIIPTSDTGSDVLNYMVQFGSDVLGKGVVVCKDTPNFIANRFIAIVGSYISEYALENGYTVAEVDAITGPLVGHPKTATFRLTDLVGLDVMMHVNNNLYPAIPHDSYREVLKSPRTNALNRKMADNGWLGNKSGQGFYKKAKVAGKREFHTLNLETLGYFNPPKARFDSVGAVRKIEDLGERLGKLLEFDDRAAEFVRATTYYSLAYAAYATPEIAHNIVDVDNANKWGFAHEAGPFEIWDMLGVADTAAKMQAAGYEIAGWVQEMLDSGHDSFYQDGRYYDFQSGRYTDVPGDDKQITVANLIKNEKQLEQNGSARLHDMGDGVLLYEFNAKMNAIDADIVEMGNKALARLNTDFDAMVMGNNGDNFCVGANIAMVGMAAAQGFWDQLDKTIKDLQAVTFNLRHAPKPVVTAPHQMALGGGAEMVMAGWTTAADHETYIGLVEVGVGLIPAGGGLKELLRRKVNPVMKAPNADVLPIMQEVFQNTATAKVATSAWEAREMGFLSDDGTIVMNSDHRLALAKQKALQLVAARTRPPEVEKIYAAGQDMLSALYLGLKSFQWGNYASEHDVLIGRKLAYVLCGGDLSQPAWVDPWYILNLERQMFLELLHEEKTRERIMHMLQTGKPLRN
ncbi:MAG: 3-hydroxyacyl-CoA dehydrogenase/enoyl-CoA hydratase family protein [Chloroflexi bacterium]|nr:3-hydroxyacyl-CoA dehydrogenase/enoyl-CoA hydratase family protein [Chloroflexota bacterium]